MPTISLETVAVPGATPIAYNSASAKSFAADYFKLTDLSERDRKTIRVVALIAKLNAAGGTNYTSNHDALRQDSKVYSGAIPKFNQEVGAAVTDWNAGKATAASLSTDIPTLIASAPQINQQSAEELDREIAFLKAQLQQ